MVLFVGTCQHGFAGINCIECYRLAYADAQDELKRLNLQNELLQKQVKSARECADVFEKGLNEEFHRRQAAELQVGELQKELAALRHTGQHMTCGQCEQLRETQMCARLGCGWNKKTHINQPAKTCGDFIEKPKCVCDRCKKEFNDNDSNWCLACRKESHESMEKRKCGLSKPLGHGETCVKDLGHLDPCDHQRKDPKDGFTTADGTSGMGNW